MRVEDEGQPDRIKHSVNPAFQGAWWIGFAAGVTGKTRHACPYKKGRRTKKKPGTFRLAFRAFWMNGWQTGRNHRLAIEREYFTPWSKLKRSEQLTFEGALEE